MSDSKQSQVPEFRGLMIEDNQLYAAFVGPDNELTGIALTRMQVSAMFPRMIARSGQFYLSSADGLTNIEIDLDGKIAKLVFNEQEIERLKSIAGGPPVPTEFADKYCLLFGGKVIFSADTKKEIEHYEREHPSIGFTQYVPSSQKK